MYSKMISLLCILSFPILTGCNEKTISDGDVITCTEEFSPGVRVNVFDKETGFPSACGAKLTNYYLPLSEAYVLRKLCGSITSSSNKKEL